ncbi:NHL repeat-containing protein [Caballeronia terrestris]|uniref:NHL repeat-containing protein n=1 Tax=Caballeronia terrestris TaxID=1226301 RepID=UPI001F3D827E|nr:NHL repeat-containing protein [Caballeronia terrestris]
MITWFLSFCVSVASCGGGNEAANTPVSRDESVAAFSKKPSEKDIGLFIVAGRIGGTGSLDGTGVVARFGSPQSIAADSAGNLYVADTGNHIVRKITPAGVVTTLAGTAGVTGSADGSGAAAQFNLPQAIAAEPAGNLYVADTANHIVRKITPAGVVTTLAGTAGVTGSADGSGAAARFNYPQGIATDSAGNVYVTDSGSTIRKITPAGVVTTLAGTAGMWGYADGSGAAGRFSGLRGIGADAAGNLYVADSGNNTIRKITPAGVVTTLAGTAGVAGRGDGSGAAAQFDGPTGIAADDAGNVHVADTNNYTVRKITAAGAVTTLAGRPGVVGHADGNGAAARFNYPIGIAADYAGHVYVADTSNFTIRKITAAGAVTTLAGDPVVTGHADGSGAAAEFNFPAGIAADRAGNLYVADTNNSSIRKITAAGVVTTLAGTPGVSGAADGSGAAARFSYPFGIAADRAGNVYVADSGNNTIRKITPAGVVTTLAGTAGVSGIADGSGAAAQFHIPSGIAADRAGNLYVADKSSHTIRKITAAGMVTTLAGTPGVDGSADGSGTAARFSYPVGIAADRAGNVYVADSGNHTIRKITPSGFVTTLAGTAGVSGSADGSGAAAQFYAPHDIAADHVGNLYVADFGNGTIRKITAAGVVTTVAGVAQQQGIRLGCLPGRLSMPLGVTLAGHDDTLGVTSSNSVLKLVLRSREGPQI